MHCEGVTNCLNNSPSDTISLVLVIPAYPIKVVFAVRINPNRQDGAHAMKPLEASHLAPHTVKCIISKVRLYPQCLLRR